MLAELQRSSTLCSAEIGQGADMKTRAEPPSHIAVAGLDRTPHRAFMRACGLDDGGRTRWV
jgi:hypothetical protein